MKFAAALENSPLRHQLPCRKYLQRKNYPDGECGEPSCLAFATRLSLADKDVRDCTRLSKDQAAELKKMLNEA